MKGWQGDGSCTVDWKQSPLEFDGIVLYTICIYSHNFSQKVFLYYMLILTNTSATVAKL
jgi:hypothetical protein